MPFKLSNLNSNLALTLGYLNPALNNSALSLKPSTDVMQLTLTLKMTTAKVVETSVTVKNNNPLQDNVHPDDHTQST